MNSTAQGPISWLGTGSRITCIPPTIYYVLVSLTNIDKKKYNKNGKDNDKQIQEQKQRQRHSDLAPRAIDQTSVDCQLPVEQMFHLTLEKFLKIVLPTC